MLQREIDFLGLAILLSIQEVVSFYKTYSTAIPVCDDFGNRICSWREFLQEILVVNFPQSAVIAEQVLLVHDECSFLKQTG